MFLTFGLPGRHPIVILGVINTLLTWLLLYISACVFNEPSGRYPYPMLVIGSILWNWAPIYLVARPEEMSRAFFNWPPKVRIVDESPRGSFFRALGYVLAVGSAILYLVTLWDAGSR